MNTRPYLFCLLLSIVTNAHCQDWKIKTTGSKGVSSLCVMVVHQLAQGMFFLIGAQEFAFDPIGRDQLFLDLHFLLATNQLRSNFSR